MAEKKKVVVTFATDPHIIPGYDNYVSEFEQKGFEVILDPRYRRLNQDEIIEVLQKHNAYAYVLSGEQVGGEILDACPSVKMVLKMGAGVNSIDIDACNARGVAVSNTPGANAEAVAEHAFAMMLALTRKLVMLDNKMRDGVYKTVFGTCMLRKTLGIVGFGNIGKNVAKFVQGLDMRVLAYDVYQDEETAKKYNCTFVPLETLLKESDFITIHAPNIEATVNMIGAKEFDMMKDGVQFCNCARGSIVDEKAMIAALKSGKLKGAALDAFVEEPLPMSSELYTLENVILSPHTAGMTYEGRGKVVQMAFQNVFEFSEGKVPLGIVNKELFIK